MLLTGRVSDVFGRRHVVGWQLLETEIQLLGGLVLFGLSTAAGGFLSNIIGIYFLQGLAGCGTALVIPASLGIIAACFPLGKPRVYAYAAFSAGGPAGECFVRLMLKCQVQEPVSWSVGF
jgi:MFS family permease